MVGYLRKEERSKVTDLPAGHPAQGTRQGIFAAQGTNKAHSSQILEYKEQIKPRQNRIYKRFIVAFLSYRSGETRTRGLLLPKQARYQLRNTP